MLLTVRHLTLPDRPALIDTSNPPRHPPFAPVFSSFHTQNKSGVGEMMIRTALTMGRRTFCAAAAPSVADVTYVLCVEPHLFSTRAPLLGATPRC